MGEQNTRTRQRIEALDEEFTWQMVPYYGWMILHSGRILGTRTQCWRISIWPKWTLRNPEWKYLAPYDRPWLMESLYGKNPTKYVHLLGSPHKETSSCPRNRSRFYTTIKNPPKPSKNKVCIIYPNCSTLKLWKFSNLIFGRYLAGIIPILSTRSSLFLFHKCCLEHARTVWLTDDFWHH